ncbi:helix-turn-helix domain-containing protein, partial [Bradyrhizobium sp. NBAIM08]|uniref:helix-turn-helix domain-containing protein n=1 Tax=Bradyrhizobium sp. NBAIM08 TaxID=2793815 RepID=UPI001CD740AE
MRARKPKEPPPPESLVLSTLRKARGWTGQDLANASGTSAQMISVYEAGRRPPSRGRLVALAAAMGYGTEAVDLVLLALKGAAGGVELPRAPVDPAAGELRDIRTVAARVGVAAVDLTERSLVRLLR